MPWIEKSHRHGDAAFEGISTDSRSISPGNLFVALKGVRFDGHDYLNEIQKKGAAAVIAENIPEDFALPRLMVENSLLALGEMAKHYRRRFTLPVIAVTGSNGKTTVKEMIAKILEVHFGQGRFLATEGNLNNEIGVPKTLFNLDEKHKAAVIELGMNHPGEISRLAAMAEPTVALVNNAQREHMEHMQSVLAVAQENGQAIRALPADGIAVFPAEDAFSSLWEEYARQTGTRGIVTFGFTEKADVTGVYEPEKNGLAVRTKEWEIRVSLSVIGQHNAHNALAAASCAWAAGIDREHILQGLEAFRAVSGRMQQTRAANGASLIDDSYNANPDSVIAAIDVLAQAKEPRILVLGDMGETGTSAESFHREVGAYAREKGISRLFTAGELAEYAQKAFSEKAGIETEEQRAEAGHFAEIGKLLEHLETAISPSATVLVKGSRFMNMERVVAHLKIKDDR